MVDEERRRGVCWEGRREAAGKNRSGGGTTRETFVPPHDDDDRCPLEQKENCARRVVGPTADLRDVLECTEATTLRNARYVAAIMVKTSNLSVQQHTKKLVEEMRTKERRFRSSVVPVFVAFINYSSNYVVLLRFQIKGWIYAMRYWCPSFILLRTYILFFAF